MKRAPIFNPTLTRLIGKFTRTSSLPVCTSRKALALAKLIAWGDSRGAAIERMREALREIRIVGVQTSIPFHRWAMNDSGFLEGAYNTSFYERHSSLDVSDRGEDGLLAAIVALVGLGAVFGGLRASWRRFLSALRPR